MNKHQFLMTVILSFAVLFTACKKEGVYNPKEKISKIYAQFNNDTVTGDKALIEKWTWDGKILSRIDYLDEGCFETFEYNKDLLVGISGNDNGDLYYTAITYGDKHFIQKIDLYRGGKLETTIDITYNNNDKISQMKMKTGINLDYPSEKSMDKSNRLSHIMRFIVSEQFAERMQQQIQKSGVAEYTNVTLDYEGNNIKTETWTYTEYPDLRNIYTYIYDNKTNPFYYALNYNSFGKFACLSENNITKITHTTVYEGVPKINNTEYTYSYEGDFPSQLVYKHYEEIEVEDPETSEITTENVYIYTQTIFFEYQ